MSSDEDFSLVSNDFTSNLDKIQKDIEKLKQEHATLMQEKADLTETIKSNVQFTQEFQQRSVIVEKRMEEEKLKQATLIKAEQEKVESMKQEQTKLRTGLEKIQQDLDRMDEFQLNLKQQTEMCSTMPEKKVVFKGETADEPEAMSFDMKPRIVYPMEGGTAFITFEEEEVAEKILALKDHVVQLGECSITVQAEPVQFLVPAAVEVNTHVCPRRILISNLPEGSDDHILDKLEIHFSKSRNGGGEVEDRVMLEDSGSVVITFFDNNIVEGLIDKQLHEIEMERGKRHKVRVRPFLNGEITLLKMSNTSCCKTVLLTGIPAVMDRDSMQDLLEIHFQKSTNSGGEVDNIVYNPAGARTLAVFEEDASENKNNL